MMKLRNKKTGEIGNLKSFNNDKRVYVWINKEIDLDYIYNSLAELNEDWEDYEEAKDYYVINLFGEVSVEGGKYQKPGLSELGLTFETKEQAEKAVEKLKAWKRLKDKGFRFERYLIGGEYGNTITFSDYIKYNDETKEDLDLLFGGE